MVTAKQQRSIDLYHALMSEARYRIDSFNFILSGGTRLSEGVVQELCYLQLRMLCETIALGCLVAHGDIVELHFKKFEKEWSAEKIIERLGPLNPDFFPQQMDLTRDAIGVAIKGNTKANALKKDELTKLWNKCGGFLHRGSLKKIMSFDPKTQSRINIPDIAGWIQKIEDLLSSHLIPLPAKGDTNAMLVCTLRNTAANFTTTVQRVEFKRVEGPIRQAQ